MEIEGAIGPVGAAHAGLPELVYRELREAILSGVYRPGQMLRQEELANRLGVSRAPLREALPRLVAEGLVVRLPRRGYAVASLDPAEIAEIFELRALIEEKAARIATERRTAEDVASLRAIAEQMKAIQSDRSEDIALWSNLNFKFHDRLLASSGLEHFRRLAGSLRREADAYIRTEIGITGELHEAQGEHELIIDAFDAGDAERVGCLTREHCEHTAQRLLGGLKHRDSDSDKKNYL